MVVEYRKRFLKELSKLPPPYAMAIEDFVFDQLPSSDSLEEIGKIEKMTGYKNYYKVRFGDYRIGLKREDTMIVVETVRHRREIYKFFP